MSYNFQFDVPHIFQCPCCDSERMIRETQIVECTRCHFPLDELFTQHHTYDMRWRAKRITFDAAEVAALLRKRGLI